MQYVVMPKDGSNHYRGLLAKYVSSLTAASGKGKASLRTTVPKELVDLFEMKNGGKIEWEFDPTKGKLEAVVRRLDA